MTTTPFGSTVYTYSREQAIKDAILIDLSRPALENNLQISTAVTSTLFYLVED